MQPWLSLVLLSLVCYRLALLFSCDEGPTFWIFDRGIFHQIRLLTGAYDFGANGEAEMALGRMMNCPYCLGMWIALPLAFYVTGPYPAVLLWWVAIAGGQAFLQGLTK